MFSDCTKLVTAPAINTSSCTTIQSMFDSCTLLTTVPALDCSRVLYTSTYSNVFDQCPNLTNVGGLLNLGMGFGNATGTQTL